MTSVTMKSDLQTVLADLLRLSMATREAHWNIRGNGFLEAHKFLGDFYDATDAFVDEVAERVAQLGGAPQATEQARLVQGRVRWEDDNSRSVDAAFKALRDGSREVCDYLPPMMDKAIKGGDWGSADMLTRLSQMLDKNIWFMSAYLGQSPVRK